MPKILVFIPFYNCEQQLPRVLAKLSQHMNWFHHVLLVDNRSEDKSLEMAQQWASEQLIQTTIIRNKSNVNLGGSHKIAITFAKEMGISHLLVLHGDDQANIEDIIPTLRSQSFLQYDCVLGSRFSPESKLYGYSRFRIFGNKVLNILCSFTTRSKVFDMGAGLNLYSVTALSDSRIHSFPNNLTFNVYLLFHSFFEKQKVFFLPISWREEDQVSNAKVFKQMFIILKVIFLTLVNKQWLYLNNGPDKESYSYETIFQS